MLFKDRHDAGKKLAKSLFEFKQNKEAIVLGLARGGIVIGYEIAKELQIPLNIIVTRKIGAPDNPELAIGAITETGDGYFEERLIHSLGVNKAYIKQKIEEEKKEAQRRLSLYGTKVLPLSLEKKIAIIVDDGIATGSTMMASILSVKKQKAKKIVVAAPVAPPSSMAFIEREADEVICLTVTENFFAVSQFYEYFPQVTDQEILSLLEFS